MIRNLEFVNVRTLRKSRNEIFSSVYTDPITSHRFQVDVVPEALVFGSDYPIACVEQREALGIVLESGDYEPWVEQWSREALSDLACMQPTHLIDEACCLALPLNFCHWHQEALPKVCILEEIGFRGTYIVASYPLFRASLRLCGIPDDRIHAAGGEPIRVSRLFVPQQYPIADNSLFPSALMLTRERCMGGADRSIASERVFIDRSAGTHRSLVGREELDLVLESLGFETVFMENLSLPQQIGLASSAKVIAGPHGAGMAAALFMRRFGQVYELFSPLYINTCIIPICRLLGLDYHPVVAQVNPVGSYAHGEQVMPNMNVLRYLLDKHL